MSLNDYRSFAHDNVEPVSVRTGDNGGALEWRGSVTPLSPLQRMLAFLESNYRSDVPEREATSLSIFAGREGARLTHGHATQFAYVRQSLLLWRTILRDFYAMWKLAE